MKCLELTEQTCVFSSVAQFLITPTVKSIYRQTFAVTSCFLLLQHFYPCTRSFQVLWLQKCKLCILYSVCHTCKEHVIVLSCDSCKSWCDPVYLCPLQAQLSWSRPMEMGGLHSIWSPLQVRRRSSSAARRSETRPLETGQRLRS